MAELEIVIPTTGANGNATGDKTTDATARGVLHAVKVSYDDQPVTAVVTLSEVGGLARQLLSVTGNTDGTFYPSANLCDSTGEPLEDKPVQIYLDGLPLQVTIASGDASPTAVTVQIVLIGR